MPTKTKTAGVQATRPAKGAYRDDLAYIHDTGFGDFAVSAAPWLLAKLRAHDLYDGLVIDLGCGSGILARELSLSGYGVLGYDISESMIALARRRAPRGEFHVKPLSSARIRPCVAVTAIGEVFNYVFGRRNDPRRLDGVFGRVYEALLPGGLFVFDVATPGRVPGGRQRSFKKGSDWACLYETEEDTKQRTLTRRITTFRRSGQHFRRDDEVHRLRLYDRDKLLSRLRKTGFRATAVGDYGKTKFPAGYAGFVARKPK